ncbi:MAG: hypothetical protein IPK80_34620 [Nannocystis sp.]|nr:hypothetical protein [Nannocystis sp.]
MGCAGLGADPAVVGATGDHLMKILDGLMSCRAQRGTAKLITLGTAKLITLGTAKLITLGTAKGQALITLGTANLITREQSLN